MTQPPEIHHTEILRDGAPESVNSTEGHLLIAQLVELRLQTELMRELVRLLRPLVRIAGALQGSDCEGLQAADRGMPPSEAALEPDGEPVPLRRVPKAW